MVRHGKMQRVTLSTLGVMLVVSLVLAVMAFATPAPASAGGPGHQPRMICYGWVCEPFNPCIILDQKTHHCCNNLCEHPVGGLYCATGWFCCTENTCNGGG